MNALLALALNGFREARRNRVTMVVLVFAFVMIFSATVALEITVSTYDRVMTDLGLGVMSIISVFLTIFLASGLIPREIERRTIFMVLAKPVSRSAFVVGRYLGNVATVFFVFAMMAALFILQLFFQGSSPNHAHFASFVGILLQIIVLTAVAFAFAAGTSQFVTAVASTGMYFLGHLASDLYGMAEKSKSAALKGLGTVLYYVLPNLDRLDFKARATYVEVTTVAELGSATLYAIAYSVAMLAIACLVFERRDFK